MGSVPLEALQRTCFPSLPCKDTRRNQQAATQKGALARTGPDQHHLGPVSSRMVRRNFLLLKSHPLGLGIKVREVIPCPPAQRGGPAPQTQGASPYRQRQAKEGYRRGRQPATSPGEPQSCPPVILGFTVWLPHCPDDLNRAAAPGPGDL